jgi:hypothetical protein
MRESIRWLNDALAVKGIAREMQYYRVEDDEIRATDGRITAGCPWPYGGSFLIPGRELERVLSRLTGDVSLKANEDGNVVLKSGKFRGTIRTLPLERWQYPGVDTEAWETIPPDLLGLVSDLRPFVSENATQHWAMGVALDNGWAYATNNICLAGGKCKGLGKINVILPVWAIDFISARQEGLIEWAWTENFVAFKWANGSWMRSNLIDGSFPEKASELIRAAVKEKTPQEITPEFKAAFTRISELAEDTVAVYADRIEAGFGEASVEEEVECEAPPSHVKDSEGRSLWGARFVLPVMAVASHWAPATWPKPTPFKGPKIAGYVVGRSK